MTQRGLFGLIGLAILLAGTIALELTGRVADDGDMIADTSRPTPVASKPSAPRPAREEDRQALLDAILARPLFASTRRPVAAPTGPAPLPASLPRLAGILLHGGIRSAIFAGTGGAKPVVVQEGAQIGGFTVQLIEAGQVTLGSTGGAQVVRPSFDARPQSAASGPATAPGRGVPAPFAATTPAPFAATTDVMQSLRGLPGFPGAAR